MEPPIHSRSRSSPPHLPFISHISKNSSFARLARLVGLSTDPPQPNDDSDGDEVGACANEADGLYHIYGDDDDDVDSHDNDAQSEEVDEQSLMWDAQTALIAHQPSLAAEYYSIAALPPFRSAPACLALGNLLARGSGLSQQQSETDNCAGSNIREEPTVESIASASPPTSWLSSLFRSSSPPSSPSSEQQPRRLVANGWSLPTDGKRVVRDVEGMGRAGGWLILGVGWVIDDEIRRSVVTPAPYGHQQAGGQSSSDDEQDMIVFNSKGKGNPDQTAHSSTVHNASDPEGRHPQDRSAASSVTDSTDYSTVLRTPGEGSGDKASDENTIKLLYDLIITLLQLYRHGHIQRHDPVALPPIPFAQLPQVLQPHGDKEKGRNVWYLGGVVAARLLELPLLHMSTLSTESRQKRDGVNIMAQYILGATSSPRVAESCFRSIIKQGPCGLPIPDDLIRQAFRRVNIILKSVGGTPISPAEMDAYPFPTAPNATRAHRSSVCSTASAADSLAQSALKLVTPVKSSASLASLSCDSPSIDIDSPHDAQSALNALRRVQRKQDKMQRNLSSKSTPESPWWPALNNWNMSQRVTAPSSSGRKGSAPSSPMGLSCETKKQRSHSIACTPSTRCPSSSSPPERRRLPFEPTEPVASIDPELAALELSSALTKHVTCSVCGVDGVNFPNCRKCGLTFCSRSCRTDGAGNGKRHICGAFESRKLHDRPPSPAQESSATVTATNLATPVH